MSSATAPARATSSRQPDPRRVAGSARFDSPVTTYYLLVGATVVLVVFGLVMVLSASSIVSIDTTTARSPYAIFLSQAVFAVHRVRSRSSSPRGSR